MKPLVDIKMFPIKEEEYLVIADFLIKYFFPEEPLNSSLQRCPSPEEFPFTEILKEGMSMKAVNVLDNSKNNIAGVVVNKSVLYAKKDVQKEVNCPKRIKIMKVLKELDTKADIWEKVNNEDHFNILCVSVNSAYRGLGVGQKLIEESLKLAKSLNYNYATIECSSFFSARIAIQMGFQLLAEIPYDEYLDENSEKVFKVKAPHVALKKLYKKLN